MDNVSSLSIGEPDFQTPWHIREAGIRSLEKGKTWYSPNKGFIALREEISNYYKRRFNVFYNSENQIIVTVGGSEGIDLALRTLVEKGDEVLIPQPAFVCYDPLTCMAGGKPVFIETKAENNFRLTKEELEAQLKHRLRVQRIVWLDHGNLIGDDTDGHIDTIVRPAPEDTLLYVGTDNPKDEQYADFQLLEKQLQDLRTADGRPYQLLKLPMPEPIFEDDGHRLPATYANFLILNEAVLVPIYGQHDNDQRALNTIQQAFPDRKMVPIDSRTIIRQHGAIHCLTMQIPQWKEESEK
jgi:bifunctional pyridoxal-dependent enzyme with beta-cystathionase and maltose regulon repressor activities